MNSFANAIYSLIRKIKNKLGSLLILDRNPSQQITSKLKAHPSCEIYIDKSASIECSAIGSLEIGMNTQLHVHDNAKIIVRGNFTIGRNCTIIVHNGGLLLLGEDSWCLHDCWIEVAPRKTIELGNRTSLQLRCSLHG